jgi:hypothetical protein
MWLFLGFIASAVYLAVILWLRSKNTFLKWYEWTLGIIGLLLLAFALQNYFASVKELEPIAPGIFMLVFGIPAGCFVLISVLFPLLRYFRSSRKATGIIEKKAAIETT